MGRKEAAVREVVKAASEATSSTRSHAAHAHSHDSHTEHAHSHEHDVEA